jgi:hypothetical protein
LGEPPVQGYTRLRGDIGFGGIFTEGDSLWLARAYKTAADRLVECVLPDLGERAAIYPIIFKYRHSVEL